MFINRGKALIGWVEIFFSCSIRATIVWPKFKAAVISIRDIVTCRLVALSDVSFVWFLTTAKSDIGMTKFLHRGAHRSLVDVCVEIRENPPRTKWLPCEPLVFLMVNWFNPAYTKK